jgi:hypothetical protein
MTFDGLTYNITNNKTDFILEGQVQDIVIPNGYKNLLEEATGCSDPARIDDYIRMWEEESIRTELKEYNFRVIKH